MHNNDKMGGATPHNAYIACAIDRGAGYAKTEDAVSNRTCSRYKGGSKHNHWEGAGSGTSGNMMGWGKHGGGTN